jgi:predicted phage tail protein|tara:strand:- start:12 stop:674 length:663 start_codon:yes stop_codon:yes gene_type:complete
MKVVKVYGALRKELGQTRFEFVADTPAQAMRALLVNFPRLQQWLIDSEKRGVAYRVTVGKQKVHNEDVSGLFTPWSERDVFSITPVMTGAGRGTGMLLMGAALIGASFLLPGAGLFGTQGLITGAATGTFSGLAATSGLAGTLTTVATSLSYIGAGLVLSGVATMLSPTPKPPREASRLESNSFSGVVQTTRQGVPVPIAYGRVFVGSVVISAGLDIDQV